jgi:hypothetical protein
VNSHRISKLLVAVSFGVFAITTYLPSTAATAASCVPTVSSSGSDVVLTFINTSNCDWVVPSGVTRLRVLLIGGGGGGGFDIGGGGGAGGFREASNVVTTPGEVVTMKAGVGGDGDTSRGMPCVGSNGTSSSIALASGILTAIGGGGGGGQDGGGNCATDGVAGGSGGGGGVGIQWPREGGAGTYATDSEATTFGNAGGNASPSSYYAGGGGGGAGAVGSAGSSDNSGAIGGAGGIGKISNITGGNITYAGGGAGGFFQSGTRGEGGSGGGGDGGTDSVSPVNGTHGLGGGGGGGGVQNGVHGQGARGGNGVVIVRYSVVVATTTTTTTTTTTLPPVLEIVVSVPSSTTLPSGQANIPSVSTPVVVQSTIAKTPVTTSTTVLSTTTVVSASSSSSTIAPVPKISAVVAGEAGVKVGNKVETATVQRIDNQLVVSAGPLKATLGGINADGSSVPLDDDGNVRLKSGDVVRIKLAGFKARSIVEAWLFSTPSLLGTVKVASDGTVTGAFSIPKNVESGSHRIAIVAKTADGKPATLTVGVMVGNLNNRSQVTVWLIVLPIALAVAGALALPARRRRRRLGSSG